MKIRSITFSPPEPEIKIIKSVTIYISEKHSEIIVAPKSKEPNGGYNYEQDICDIIDLKSSMEIIGKTVKRNFDKFNIKIKKAGMGNKSEWLAYKLSKEKSIRGFEENYKRISIIGITDLNISLKIETVLNLPSEIELTSTISAHCEPIDLGNRILRLFYSDIVKRK